jgi:glycerophosphoryl diester phosphodiesterase
MRVPKTIPSVVPVMLVAFVLCTGCREAGEGPGMMIIAHRGASAHAPEHTFASWDLALEMGADYLEQDLQMTADGHLVVLHDDTLDRTARGANCRGPVRARTLEQIASCDVGVWFSEAQPERTRAEFAGQRIPTLDAVLGRYAARARFYIETKDPESSPGMEEALITLLDRHDLLPANGNAHRVIVQSFSTASLRRVHELNPSLLLVQLFPGRETSATIRARLSDLDGLVHGIGPHFADVDSVLVAVVHSRGLVIHPYTVNETSDMRRLMAIGVDGMFTDYPDVLAAILGRSDGDRE